MTNTHEQAERAGFDSLSRDQREAIARYQASGERARRITEQGPELARILTILLQIAGTPAWTEGSFRLDDALTDGRVAIARIEGSR